MGLLKIHNGSCIRWIQVSIESHKKRTCDPLSFSLLSLIHSPSSSVLISLWLSGQVSCIPQSIVQYKHCYLPLTRPFFSYKDFHHDIALLFCWGGSLPFYLWGNVKIREMIPLDGAPFSPRLVDPTSHWRFLDGLLPIFEVSYEG